MEKEAYVLKSGNYQDNLKTELKIQEELASRYNNYSKTLKKEVVF